VFVLGAPRGGTSAITRVVNMVGVPISDEKHLKAPNSNNPTGFWEVPELSRVNHVLLRQFGALSMVPCFPPVGWYEDPRVLEAMDEIRETSTRLLGAGPWVFKTALSSFTLPFWVRCLDARPVIVLPVRHPLENAASLSAYIPRQASEAEDRRGKPSMTMASALAIWERYIRASLIHAEGYPTYVSISSELINDPAEHARDLGRFLERHGALAGKKADEREIVSFVRPDLRHHTAEKKLEDPSRGVMTDAQLRLWKLTQQLAGSHEPLPALDIGPESPTNGLLMSERRLFEEMVDDFRAREKRMRPVRVRLLESIRYRRRRWRRR
jgi:hypothetical protein